MQRSKWNNERFLKEAKEIHGDKYGYGEVNVTTGDTKVNIFCFECVKYFPQSPTKHIVRKQGCPYCGQKKACYSRRWTYSKFIERSKIVHGDNKFKYIKSEFDNRKESHEKISIKCDNNNHDWFQQSITSHLHRGSGCDDCAIENSRKFKNAKEFEAYAKEIHYEKFELDTTNFIDLLSIIKRKCNIHQIWEERTAKSHLMYGCATCDDEFKRKPLEQWIAELEEIYGKDSIDFSLITDLSYKKIQKLRCKLHDKSFEQTLHKLKEYTKCSGCKKYRSSIPEDNLYEDLVKLSNEDNIIRWEDVHGFEMDLFVKHANTYIQLDGVYWHGLNKPLDILKNSDKEYEQRRYLRYLKDREQDEYCYKQNIKFIRITDIEYNEYHNKGVIGIKMQEILNLFK